MELVLTKRRECSQGIKLDLHFEQALEIEQIEILCQKLKAKCRNFGDLVFIEFDNGRINASITAKFLTLRCDDEASRDLVIDYLKEI
ncbi:MAG TPA: hypothetical protein ENK21_01825 [Trueperaceae bacterium]|nr:hypothetical protein [Trueperaceae bacterium]